MVQSMKSYFSEKNRNGEMEENMNYNKGNFYELEWEDVRPGVSRKLYTGEGATLTVSKLMVGHEPKPHSHSYEQITAILEGEGYFHIKGEKIRMLKGDMLVIPPGSEHFFEATGEIPVLNLDIFTPKRVDYLK